MIFHIIPSYLPDIGGAEIQLSRIVEKFEKNNLRFTILTRKSKSEKEEVYLENIKRFNRNILLFNFNVFLYLIKKRKEIKAIHVHSTTSIAYTSLLVGIILKKRVLIKITRIGKGSQVDFISRNKIKKLLLRFLLEKCNYTFINLTNESKLFLEEKIGVVKSVIIPNGIEVRNTINQKESSEYIKYIFTSRLIRRKKVYETVLSLIHNSDTKKIKILVCGGGESTEENKIRDLEEKYPDIVKFTGELTQKEVLNHLETSDFFVQNSINEGLSNSFLESLRCNLIPIVGPSRFYYDLQKSYHIPIFFDSFLQYSDNEKKELLKRHEKLPMKILKENFDIELTVKKLKNEYQST